MRPSQAVEQNPIAIALPRSRSGARRDAVVARRAKQSARAIRNAGLALSLADSHASATGADATTGAGELAFSGRRVR